MPKPSSPRYRTTNWPDYNAALRRRGSLSIWFDPAMAWHAAKTGKRGQPISATTPAQCLDELKQSWEDNNWQIRQGDQEAHGRMSLIRWL